MQSVDGDVRLSVGFDTKELQKNLSKVFADTMKSITTSSKEIDKSFIVVGNSSDTVNKTIKEINRNILKLVDLAVDFRQNMSKISGISPTLLNDFTALTKSMTEIVSQSTKFGNAWNSKKIEVDSTVSTMMQLQLNAEKAKNTVDKLKAALDALNASKSVSTKYEALNTEYNNTTNSIDKLFIEIQKTEQQLQSLKTKFGDNSDTVKQYEDYLRGLELQYSRLTAQADNLHTSLNNMKANNEVFVFNTDAEQAEFDNLQAQLENAQGQFDIARKKVEEFQQALDKISTKNANSEIESVSEPVEDETENLQEIQVPNLFGRINEQISEFVSRFVSRANAIKKSIGDMVAGFTRIAKSVKNAAKRLLDFVKNSKLAKKGTVDVNNAIKKGIGLILKYGLGIRSTYILFNKFRAATKEGYKNLAGYSDKVNKSISSVLSSLAKFKNQLAATFEPIVTVIVPILNKLIQKTGEALVALSKFFGAFTGRETVFKAKDIQEEYVESLDETAKSAEEAEKALESYLSPLDDINRFTDDKSSNKDKSKDSDKDSDKVDYSKMFTTVPIEYKFKQLVDKIKGYFATIFEPIQNAWNKFGTPVIESAKNALNSVKGVIDSVHESVLTVWTNGTGEEIVGNILQIFININDTISKISENFKTAWDSGVGTEIVQTLADTFNNILEHINNITESTSKWAESVDFTNILTAFQNLTSSIQDLIDKSGDFTEKVWNVVFLPLASWALEEAVPAAIDVISGFIDTVTAVGEKAGEILSLIWDSFFGEFVNWAGDAVVLWLNSIAQFLEDLSKNDDAITFITVLIGVLTTLAVVIGIVNAVMAINPVTIIILGIIALIAVIVEIIVYWDTLKEAWLEGVQFIRDKIVSIATKVKDWFVNGWTQFANWWTSVVMSLLKKVGGFFAGIWKKLTDGAKAAWAGIKSIFGSVATFFKTTFSKAWTAVKNVFSTGGKIFVGIKDGIVSAFKKVVNAIIGGINTVISVPFNAINNALDGIRDVEIAGFTPFAWLPTISVPQIPKLATGAVLPPNREFMAVLGDQKNGRNLEAPENLIRQIVREESANAKSNTYNVSINAGRKKFLEFILEEGKLQQAQTGRNPFALA